MSPSTEVTVAPGKHSATDAMSWKCAQVSSTDVGTVNRWVSSIRRSRPRGREHRAPGQDGGEVAPVVGVAVEVRGRVGALGGLRGRRAYGRRRSPAARPAPPRPRAARSGVEPMLVSPTRASAMVPPSTRTVAATATIGHWWATRTNFS